MVKPIHSALSKQHHAIVEHAACARVAQLPGVTTAPEAHKPLGCGALAASDSPSSRSWPDILRHPRAFPDE
jgi:hypothetical protein